PRDQSTPDGPLPHRRLPGRGHLLPRLRERRRLGTVWGKGDRPFRRRTGRGRRGAVGGGMRRLGTAALAVVVAVFFFAGPAQAHARLTRCDPSDGALLGHAPAMARCWFSERITPRLSSARLLDARGTVLPGVRVEPDPGDPTLLAV